MKHESTDTDDNTDLTDTHDGVRIEGANMNITRVENGARIIVDHLDTGQGELVNVAILGANTSGRILLDAQQAAEVADRLADAAEDADTDK